MDGVGSAGSRQRSGSQASSGSKYANQADPSGQRRGYFRMLYAAAAQAPSAIACRRGVQYHSGKSSRRFAGRSRGFVRTWASRAGGSASLIRTSRSAWRPPPPAPPASELANVQFPPADGDAAQGPSAAALERQMRRRRGTWRRRPSASSRCCYAIRKNCRTTVI
jgi:hypothetical protein